MRRVDGERRQNREDVLEKMALEPIALDRRELGAPQDDDALLGHAGAQFTQALLLIARERRDLDADLLELLGRVQPVLRAQLDLGVKLLAQARDAHHEELVEIIRRDREEAELLEERMVAVRGLLHDAPVEAQPGQLAIDETLGRIREVGCVRRRRRLFGQLAFGCARLCASCSGRVRRGAVLQR